MTKKAAYITTAITTLVVTYHAGNLVRQAAHRRLVQVAVRSQLRQIISPPILGSGRTGVLGLL